MPPTPVGAKTRRQKSEPSGPARAHMAGCTRDLPVPPLDVAVIGGGVSGLAVAHAIATRTPDRRVTVLERRTTPAPPNTWCHWDDGTNPVPEAVTATWTRWEIRTADRVVIASDDDHPYRMVRAAGYQAAMRRRLEATGRAGVTMDTPVLHASATRIRTARGEQAAATVIDARGASNDAPLPRGRVRLYQRFMGQWVRTDRPVFDESTVTLMDFTGRTGGEVAFMYVLPVSATEALVESTLFTSHRTRRHPFRADIASYLHRRWGLDPGAWRVEGQESGCIAMTDAREAADGLAAVGGGGGLTRPSTGYAYSRIQRHARRAAECLRGGRNIPVFRDSWRIRVLDAVFLRFLRDQAHLAPEVFARMFTLPGPLTVRFLTERSTLLDEVRLILALPKIPFLRAAATTFRERLFTSS